MAGFGAIAATCAAIRSLLTNVTPTSGHDPAPDIRTSRFGRSRLHTEAADLMRNTDIPPPSGFMHRHRVLTATAGREVCPHIDSIGPRTQKILGLAIRPATEPPVTLAGFPSTIAARPIVGPTIGFTYLRVPPASSSKAMSPGTEPSLVIVGVDDRACDAGSKWQLIQHPEMVRFAIWPDARRAWIHEPTPIARSHAVRLES